MLAVLAAFFVYQAQMDHFGHNCPLHIVQQLYVQAMAMSVYANMDISIIDELPPGRLPIQTSTLSLKKKDQLINRIEKACSAGSQVYWVCALIEESELMNANPVEQTYEQIIEEIPSIKCSFLHGKMNNNNGDGVDLCSIPVFSLLAIVKNALPLDEDFLMLHLSSFDNLLSC